MNTYRCFSVALLLVVPNSAMCQQQTGTVVAWQVFSDHAIVAADSKVAHTCPGITKAIVSYDVCKVLAFNNQYIFAAAGYTGRFEPCNSNNRSWNLRDITKEVYRLGNISSVHDFASKWSSRIDTVLDDDSKISPPTRHNGFVLAGLFVGVSNGKISAEVVNFMIGQDGRPHPQLMKSRGSIDTQPAAFGESAIFTEFAANASTRAKLWHKRIDKLSLDDQILALVDLTKKYEPAVGGKTDAILMTPFKTQWLSVKPNCTQ